LPRFTDIWKNWIYPPDLTDRYLQHDKWTRDILKLMLTVMVISMVLILVGVAIGFFPFIDTIPIYVMVALTLVSYAAASRGGWMWARFVPILLCLAMGIFSSYYKGFSTLGYFYVLAILLAGMLVNQAFQRIILVISIVTITYFSTVYRGQSVMDNLDILLTSLFLMIGVSVLQWYSDTRIRQVLTDRIAVNQTLSEEIERRRLAESAQQERETELRRLTENISDLITETSPTGTIKYASASYKSVLGYPPELLIGTDAFALIHPRDLQRAVAAMQRVAETHQPGKEQVRCRNADGQYIHVEVTGSVILDDNDEVEGYVFSTRDIETQKHLEDARRESESKFEQIINSIPIGIHIFTLHEDGELVLTGYNPAADRILNLDHSELTGRSLEDVYPFLIQFGVLDHLRRIALEGGLWKNDALMLSDDISKDVYDIVAFQSAPMQVVVVFSDVTERIQAAEALRLSEEKFSKAFFTSPDSININRLSDGMYMDINQGFTRMTGFTREDVVGKTSLELNIWVDPADRTRLVDGLQKFGEVTNLQAKYRGKNGQIIDGLMSASVIEINHEKWLLNITRDITDRIRSEQELQQTHEMLTQAYDATLKGWVIALEMREHETADHSRRVVDLTRELAMKFGYEGMQLEHLLRGALLHDIGKMGVPDQILLKPGRLDEEEWIVMRTHPGNGFDMLNQIEYLRPSMDIPYSHHERWDGSGYPRGLKGEEIPLAARIFAVVDVYDALLTDRPYRAAWPLEDVINYLMEQKGRQFDPHVVDEFLPLVYQSGGQYPLKMD
jgi:PAS domain S-box-containing protein